MGLGALLLGGCSERPEWAGDPAALDWGVEDWTAAFARLEALDGRVLALCPEEFAGDRASYGSLVDGLVSWWDSAGIHMSGLVMSFPGDATTQESDLRFSSLDPAWEAAHRELEAALTAARDLPRDAEITLVDASSRRLGNAVRAFDREEPWLEVEFEPCDRVDPEHADPAWETYGEHHARPFEAQDRAVRAYLDGKVSFAPAFDAVLRERDALRRSLEARVQEARGEEARALAEALLDRSTGAEEPTPTEGDPGADALHAAATAITVRLQLENARALQAYVEEGLRTLPEPEASTVLVRVVDVEASRFGETWDLASDRSPKSPSTQEDPLRTARRTLDGQIEGAAARLDAVEIVHVDLPCPTPEALARDDAKFRLESEIEVLETRIAELEPRYTASLAPLAEARRLEPRGWWRQFESAARERLVLVTAAGR